MTNLVPELDALLVAFFRDASTPPPIENQHEVFHHLRTDAEGRSAELLEPDALVEPEGPPVLVPDLDEDASPSLPGCRSAASMSARPTPRPCNAFVRRWGTRLDPPG